MDPTAQARWLLVQLLPILKAAVQVAVGALLLLVPLLAVSHGDVDCSRAT
jgi:hypothetical protein